MRAVSSIPGSIGAAPMIWDKFSIFRTNNHAIACSTRAYMLREFLRLSRGKWLPKFSEMFYAFGQQLKTLQYANEPLVRVRLSFQKLLQTRQTSRNNEKLSKTQFWL